MSSKNSLGKLTILYLVGNLASRVINFAMFFVYTFYLSKKDIGLYDVIQNGILLITPILSLQLFDALFRQIITETDKNKISKVITSAFVVTFICLLAFTILYFFVFDYIYDQYKFEIYFLVISQTLFLFFPQLARGLQKNNVYVVSGVLYTFSIAIVSFILLTFFNCKIDGLIIANSAAYFAAILFVTFKIKLWNYFKFQHYNTELVKEMITYGLPLIPNTLSWWGISYANRYIILKYMNLEANGLFAVAQKLPAILYMLTVVFGMAWSEKAILSYEAENKNEYYSDVFTKYYNLIFSIVIVLLATSTPFFMFLVDAAYADACSLMPLLYLAVVFQSLANFYGTGYTSSKNTKGAFYTTLVGTIVTIVTSFVMIPQIGLYGAALSFMLGYLVMFLVRIYDTKRYFKITFPIKETLIFSLIFGVVYYLSIYKNYYIIALNLIIAGLVAVYINRDLILNYLQKFKLKLQKSS